MDQVRGVKLMILFGSQASGKASARSDTDVAVLADHPLTLREQVEISDKMARELRVNEDTIDVVDLWDASPLLQYEVARKGRLLKGTEFDLVRFKVLAWKRYVDTAKFRRLRERVLYQKYAGKGSSA